MTKFQTRHYEAIALALTASKPPYQATESNPLGSITREIVGQWRADVKAIAKLFRDDNSRFDVQRFYKACGYEGQEQETKNAK